MSERRITVVASELLGRPGTGGAGTADSLLAVALGRNGHRVELLIATGREIGGLSPEWTRIYGEANVTVRVLEPMPHVSPSYLARPFEVFQAVCDAAHIAPGGDRLSVLLELPEPMQDALWVDVARRVGEPVASCF